VPLGGERRPRGLFGGVQGEQRPHKANKRPTNPDVKTGLKPKKHPQAPDQPPSLRPYEKNPKETDTATTVRQLEKCGGVRKRM